MLQDIYTHIPNEGARIQEVTPEVAEALLSKNVDNRRVQRSRVERYKVDLSDGRWDFHGQGITLGWQGILVDGQHRLLAILESQAPAKMLIVRNDKFKKAHDARVDTQGKRADAFLLGEDRRHIGIAKALLKICNPWPGKASSVDVVGDFYNLIRQDIHKFFEKVVTTPRSGFSNNGVQAGCILRIILHPDQTDYVTTQYKALVTRDYSKYTPLTCYLEKTLEKIGSSGGQGQLKRALYAYMGTDETMAEKKSRRWRRAGALSRELEGIQSELANQLQFRQTRVHVRKRG